MVMDRETTHVVIDRRTGNGEEGAKGECAELLKSKRKAQQGAPKRLKRMVQIRFSILFPAQLDKKSLNAVF